MKRNRDKHRKSDEEQARGKQRFSSCHKCRLLMPLSMRRTGTPDGRLTIVESWNCWWSANHSGIVELLVVG